MKGKTGKEEGMKDMTAATPLTDEAFAACMQPLMTDDASGYGLAVSGGPDSMALALVASSWARVRGARVKAFIVDHGLRDESDTEANTVRQRLEALGIEAEVVRWEHGVVSSQLHVRARAGRYAALIDACKRHHLSSLLVAHHCEDQAETVLMRLAKGSGIDGLGGMDAATMRDGVRVLRPFLRLAKAQLIATCEAHGVAYVSDPSNLMPRFARGRLRRVQDMLANEGLTPERLCDLADRAREAAVAIDHAVYALLAEVARMDAWGIVRVTRAALCAAPRAVALGALDRVLRGVHAGPYPLPRVALTAALQAVESGTAFTLNGCVLRPGQRALLVFREHASMRDSASVAPGDTVLWDGRWRVTLAPDYPLIEKGEVRALGFQPRAALERFAPDLHRRVPQGGARAALPALWQGDRPVAVLAGGSENKALAVPVWPDWSKMGNEAGHG